MASLFQEQHGRGKDGLSAEVAELRAQLADESAQREVATALHHRAVKQARDLSDQLVNYGKDLSKAYREGKKAASAGAPWWRRPLALVPLATTAGLLLGAGTYASFVPSPTPGPLDPAGLYGPPAPPDLLPGGAGGGVLVASQGQLRPLGAGAAVGGTPDAAGLAATAAAAAFGPGAGTPADGTVAGTPGV